VNFDAIHLMQEGILLQQFRSFIFGNLDWPGVTLAKLEVYMKNRWFSPSRIQ